MKETIIEKMLLVRDFILAHCKFVFPILLIAAVAVTVVLALNADNGETEVIGTPDAETTQAVSEGNVTEKTVSENMQYPLVGPETYLEEEDKRVYDKISDLLTAYYHAIAEGNADVIASLQSSIEDMDSIRIVELGKYIESYPVVEIYTKPGPETNSYIALAYTRAIMSYYPEDYYPGYATFYICTGEDGTMYINQESVDEEISEYIRQVILQDDVVELCNKIEVEYKEICLNKPELFNYIAEVDQQVKQAVGVILANEINNDVSGGDVSGADAADGDISGGNAHEGQNQPDVPVDEGPTYATAKTTVNVRSSDSETADKLGKVTNGTKVKVLEQRANGWTKILFENKDGYIKSEYLELAERVSDAEIIGTVTATANVNVRASASQSSAKLGVAAGGTTLDLIAIEGEWCKVVYNEQIGYIKSEFVQR